VGVTGSLALIEFRARGGGHVERAALDQFAMLATQHWLTGVSQVAKVYLQSYWITRAPVAYGHFSSSSTGDITCA
jgi:hypothetical protein